MTIADSAAVLPNLLLFVPDPNVRVSPRYKIAKRRPEGPAVEAAHAILMQLLAKSHFCRKHAYLCLPSEIHMAGHGFMT